MTRLSSSSLLLSLGLAAACDLAEHEGPDGPDTIHEVDVEPGLKDTHDDRSPAFQSGEEALITDNALAAKGLHMDLASVERALAFQDSFGDFQSWLNLRYPTLVVGSWVTPAPARIGHVRFLGEVPVKVAKELQARPELRDRVHLIPGGRIPPAEHSTRANTAVHALLSAGYAGVAAAYDPRIDRLRIRVQDAFEEPTSEADVFSDLRTHSNTSGFSDGEVEITLVKDHRPILQSESSRGGAWLRDDGVRECTSGWTVEGPNGDGIITAGHCAGLNQYEPPGGVAAPLTWRDEVLGIDGDAEYHTTGSVEQPEFYASAGDIREVSSIRATNTMVGRTVCVYGRASNIRTCNHEITLINETVGVQLPNNGGVLVRGGLVEATNVSTQAGDSGGGWSYGTEAYGTHVGQGGGYSYFFPVEGAETELNVTILTN